jgi:hypothetical protein
MRKKKVKKEESMPRKKKETISHGPQLDDIK